MGIIDSRTVHWQGPPNDIKSNQISFDIAFRTFHLDMVVIKTGFLSGIQLSHRNDSVRLIAYSKSFENYTEGKIANEELMSFDDDEDNLLYNLKDKIPLVSKRPGKIATNWNYRVLFGTSNQEGKKLKVKVLLRIKFIIL